QRGASAMNVAAEAHPAPRARTRVMIAIAGAILILFVILLLVGVVARVRTDRELKTAAQSVQTAVQQVAVIRANPAADADLSLAGTTQAIKDSIIYARTSGYLRKRYVDIGEALLEVRSEEHTSEPSHLVISYAVFCLKKKKKHKTISLSTAFFLH